MAGQVVLIIVILSSYFLSVFCILVWFVVRLRQNCGWWYSVLLKHLFGTFDCKANPSWYCAF